MLGYTVLYPTAWPTLLLPTLLLLYLATLYIALFCEWQFISINFMIDILLLVGLLVTFLVGCLIID